MAVTHPVAKRADLTDTAICVAIARAAGDGPGYVAYEALAELFPPKVVERAWERAASRGLIDYGVSLRTAWLTEAGKRLAAEHIA